MDMHLPWIAQGRATHELEGQPNVFDVAPHRALRVQQLMAYRRLPIRVAGRARNAAKAGLDRRDACALRRVAQRPPVVVSKTQGHHSRGDRHGIAATRAAGSEQVIPRVDGRAIELVVGVPAQSKLRQVAASDYYRVLRLEVRDLGRIV